MTKDSGEKNVAPEEEFVPRGRHFRAEPVIADDADSATTGDDEPVGDPAPQDDPATDAAEGPEPIIDDEEPAWPTLDELPQKRRRSEESIRRHARKRMLRRLRIVGVVLLALALVGEGPRWPWRT